MIVILMAFAIINSLLIKLIFLRNEKSRTILLKMVKIHEFMEFFLGRSPCTQKGKKPHFFEQEILSITRKIWSKVGCPQ